MKAKSSEADRGWLGARETRVPGSVTGRRASLSCSGHWRRNAAPRRRGGKCDHASKMCGPEPHLEIHDRSFLSSFPTEILVFGSPRSTGENNLGAGRKMASRVTTRKSRSGPASVSPDRQREVRRRPIGGPSWLSMPPRAAKGSCRGRSLFNGTSVQGPSWDQTNGT